MSLLTGALPGLLSVTGAAGVIALASAARRLSSGRSPAAQGAGTGAPLDGTRRLRRYTLLRTVGPDGAPDQYETTLPVLRTVTRDADAVTAMDPDPHSAARHEHAELRPLVHALVSRPVTSPQVLPLPLLPAETLASRAAALVAAELDRRAGLAPAERQAQEAFRRRLHDRLRPPVHAPGPETATRSRPSTAAARSRSTTTSPSGCTYWPRKKGSSRG